MFRERFYIHVRMTVEVEMKQKQNNPAAEPNALVARVRKYDCIFLCLAHTVSFSPRV